MRPTLSVAALLVSAFCPASHGQGDQVSQLITALKDSDYHIRQNAAQELGKLRDPRAIEPLIVALRDEYFPVRNRAAFALGNIKDPGSVELLLAVLKGPDFDSRNGAATALGIIKDPRTVDPLIVDLKDANAHVRDCATSALGWIGDARAVEPLLVALSDSDHHVRNSAALALGSIKDLRAIDPLIGALKDPLVAADAALARSHFNDPRTVEPLIAVLNNPDSKVRKYAADALGKLRDSRALEALAKPREPAVADVAHTQPSENPDVLAALAAADPAAKADPKLLQGEWSGTDATGTSWEFRFKADGTSMVIEMTRNGSIIAQEGLWQLTDWTLFYDMNSQPESTTYKLGDARSVWNDLGIGSTLSITVQPEFSTVNVALKLRKGRGDAPCTRHPCN